MREGKAEKLVEVRYDTGKMGIFFFKKISRQDGSGTFDDDGYCIAHNR